MKKVKKIAALFCMLMSAISLPSNPSFGKNGLYQNVKNLSCNTSVATSFHYIKCLSKSTYFLSCLQKQHYCYQPCNIIEHEKCIQIDSTVFFHHTMRSCVQKMIQTSTLKPLLMLLQEVRKYHLLQDSQFFHEFFLLIFIVHKQILFHECKESSHSLKKTTFTTILEISEKINQLPIAELLNAIDMLVTELPPFLEKYEFHSKITWKNWFKKYWWVPPIFGAWFGLKILLSLQRQQFYYSHYTSPKPQISLQPIITNDPALLEIRQGENESKKFDADEVGNQIIGKHKDPICIT